ncbi:hypothetical protein Q9L58_007644 [Maublancomyces gigas]|uniref:Uncharacterized protein n=1 Tax=Discina gigas TaxID=1032678 RepID=A0ABR3GBY8_9PEZI
MTIHRSDLSGYAIVVVAHLNDYTVASLYHWRHVLGARVPTEFDFLEKEEFKACPPIDLPGIPNRADWVESCLAPALDGLSKIVPRDTKIAICLIDKVTALTDYPRDEIKTYCNAENPTPPPRAKSPVDVTTEEKLEERVVEWVDKFLRPALDITLDSTPIAIQLYLPTKDLCANPHNDYNSVRDQIMNRLRANPPTDVTVILAGSSDDELPGTILDRVFDEHKNLLTGDKFVVTIAHMADTTTIFVDKRSTAGYKPRGSVQIPDGADDTALEDVFKKALRFVRDTKDDKTPFVVLFVNLDGKAGGNDLFHDRARRYWGTEHTEWGALVEPDVKDHDELVEMLEEKFSHVVVVDAGSGGTRDFVYSWLPPSQFEVVNQNG